MAITNPNHPSYRQTTKLNGVPEQCSPFALRNLVYRPHRPIDMYSTHSTDHGRVELFTIKPETTVGSLRVTGPNLGALTYADSKAIEQIRDVFSATSTRLSEQEESSVERESDSPNTRSGTFHAPPECSHPCASRIRST